MPDFSMSRVFGVMCLYAIALSQMSSCTTMNAIQAHLAGIQTAIALKSCGSAS